MLDEPTKREMEHQARMFESLRWVSAKMEEAADREYLKLAEEQMKYQLRQSPHKPDIMNKNK